jgi:hypothetical protein
VDTLVRTFTVQISAVTGAPDFTAGTNQTVATIGVVVRDSGGTASGGSICR